MQGGIRCLCPAASSTRRKAEGGANEVICPIGLEVDDCGLQGRERSCRS
jgi:hypothetical protein